MHDPSRTPNFQPLGSAHVVAGVLPVGWDPLPGAAPKPRASALDLDPRGPHLVSGAHDGDDLIEQLCARQPDTRRLVARAHHHVEQVRGHEAAPCKQ